MTIQNKNSSLSDENSFFFVSDNAEANEKLTHRDATALKAMWI